MKLLFINNKIYQIYDAAKNVAGTEVTITIKVND